MKDAVQAFFEQSGVRHASGVGDWTAAFRAIRQNEYMAESFLGDLRALLRAGGVLGALDAVLASVRERTTFD